MIAGNPRAGRRITTAALVVLFVVLMSAAFVAMRKKPEPHPEPPLHPSIMVQSGFVTG